MSGVREGLFAEHQPEREGVRPTKDWEVRLATAEDAWAIATVVQEREGGDLDEMRAHAGRELAAIASGAEDALWVGERGGEIVAFARACHKRPTEERPLGDMPEAWILGGVIVSPPHRRLGIAHELVRARIEWLKERTDVCYYAGSIQNQVTIDLHAPFGFEQVKYDIDHPGVGFTGGVGALYRLHLNP